MAERESTVKKKAAMIQALCDKHGIITEAIKVAGISRDCHYDWLAADEDYKKAAETAQEIALDFVEGRLFGNIRRNKEISILFYLKTKGKKRGYIERSEVDLSSTTGGAMIILPNGREVPI